MKNINSANYLMEITKQLMLKIDQIKNCETYEEALKNAEHAFRVANALKAASAMSGEDHDAYAVVAYDVTKYWTGEIHQALADVAIRVGQNAETILEQFEHRDECLK